MCKCIFGPQGLKGLVIPKREGSRKRGRDKLYLNVCKSFEMYAQKFECTVFWKFYRFYEIHPIYPIQLSIFVELLFFYSFFSVFFLLFVASANGNN